jgi:hypothetical protein
MTGVTCALAGSGYLNLANNTTYSVYFDGADALSLDSSTSPDLNIGYNQFCLEGWVKYDQWDDSTELILGNGYGTPPPLSDIQDTIQIRLSRANTSIGDSNTDPVLMGVIYENPDAYSVKSNKLLANTWYHFAFVKWHADDEIPYTGTKELRMYIDGVLQGNTDISFSIGGSPNGPQVSAAGYDLTLGGRKNSSGVVTLAYAGYVSNFRMVIGDPVYTSNFTAPTSPLLSIANTEFLLAKKSTLIDVGPKLFTVNNSGAIVSTVSPFTP